MSEQKQETLTQAEHVEVQRMATEPCHVMSPQAAVASKGLAQMFGLDIRAAVLLTIVDLMIFSVDVVSGGAFILMGMLIAGALGFIVYKIQKHWFGDDDNSAMIKSLIVGLLTAIPAPLTPLIAIPGGILGLIHLVKRR